jgi:hypothetical protein
MSRPTPDASAPAHAAPELAVPLRAGPLRLVFDRGALRWIRLGEREVLRGVYVGVRGEGWGTVPATLEDLTIEAEPDAFRIRFRALHRRGELRFEWEGRIEGARDGRIGFRMNGVAGSSFRRNRIGICVLHPIDECAGRPCIVETVDGDRIEQGFPELVSPQQPFHNVRAILHEVTPGVEAEVRMEGEVFETEDQRNWADTSFKTYGTPLHLPFPVEVAAGTRIEQAVAVSLFGITAEPVQKAAASVPGALPKQRNSSEPVTVAVSGAGGRPLPALGLGGASLVTLTASQGERLKRLHLDHVRADLSLEPPGWEAALERAAANARALDVPLELALFLPDDPGAVLRPRVACWQLYRAEDGTTTDGEAALARAALEGLAPGARFGGGTDGPFAALNRRRPSTLGLDRIAFALQPQAHATDDATIVESLESLRWTADTARGFAAGAALAISPVTLRARGEIDPRQGTAFAAGWTLGLIAAAAGAGFASLTLFELVGPRGVMDAEHPFPVFHALADVAAPPGARVAVARSRRPERVQALALRSDGRMRLLLANVTGDAHPVRIEGLSGRVSRAPLGDPSSGTEAGLELDLAPHEVVRLDIA